MKIFKTRKAQRRWQTSFPRQSYHERRTVMIAGDSENPRQYIERRKQSNKKEE